MKAFEKTHRSIAAPLALSAVALAGLSAPSLAFAQTAELNSTAFQVERFQPLPGQGSNLLNVASSSVLPSAKATLGVLMHYVDDPMQLVEVGAESDPVSRIVASQLKAELSAGAGIANWIDFGAVLPVIFAQSGDSLEAFGDPGASVEGATLGDARLFSWLNLIESAGDGIGAAIAAQVALPTGDSESFNSDGVVGFEPRAILDYSRDLDGDLDYGDALPFRLAANLGYQFRPERQAQNFVSDDTLRWSLGIELPMPPLQKVPGVEEARLVATFFGDSQLESARTFSTIAGEIADGNGDPAEWLAAIQAHFGHDIVASIGGGTGMNRSVGSPDFRVLASVAVTPLSADSDMDGLLDRDDSCPKSPEDIDQWEDSDGCPDPDNDGDTLNDTEDECPNDPEDLDGFEDANGCPDPDNDGDKIPDVQDKCPDTPGVAAEQGCPIGDSDKDGIMDNDDQCPKKPEDVDGFNDEDGCPDPDNDGDGFLDKDDKCPNKAEIVNNFEDDDGCPDSAKVRITKTKVEILEKVFFESSKDEIKKVSFDLLKEVASILKANPEVNKIRIDGHTDSRGNDKKNLDLSARRAAAVQAFLVTEGVEASRLESKGFGETKPVDKNTTKAGRANNRRVEFTILEMNGKPVTGEAVIERETVETESGTKDKK